MQLFEISYAYKFLGGFYLAMAVLHMFLYLYNRSSRANLVYAFGMLMVFINFTFTHGINGSSGALKLNILTDLAANGALLYYVTNHIIKSTLPGLKKIILIFGWAYATGCLLVLINSRLTIFSTPLEMILRSVIYIVIVSSCIIGLIKKIPNFYLIVIATLLLMIMWVFFGVDLFNIWGNEYPLLRVLFILLGFISPFTSYSYYLSKYLSATKQNLVMEHTINKELSLTKLQAEKIHELDQLKSRFFANISHEFRTPLTLILSPVEKRLKEVTDPNEISGLSMIQRNASHLLHLVNQLLDLSKLESGRMNIRASEIKLNNYLRRLLFAFQSLAENRGIRFRVLPSPEVSIFVDQEKFDRIINNLLSNAFKFTRAGEEVVVSSGIFTPTQDFQEGFVEIQVIDTGIGIAKENINKIFDRFYQVDGSQTREYEGTGIGLALTKELVELHHGNISVTSTLGEGSVFTIQLPLGSHHLSPDEIGFDDDKPMTNESNEAIHIDLPESTEVGNSVASLPRVLVVEDNTELLNYLQENLKQRFNIMAAEDGEQGIYMAIHEVPDLIISDLMMPKANGLQLCQQLKEDERTSHIPIILLTARADSETKLQGYRHGADDYISKPFHFDELLVRLENLLANRKRVQDKFKQHLALRPNAIPVTSMEERFLKRAVEVVEESMADAGFGVDPFAQAMAVSQTQLYRKLLALTNFSPNEFIRHIRLERASDLLQKKAGNVSEIAYEVGINNLSYFAKIFKEKFGVTPVEFLRKSTPTSGNEK